MRAIPHTALTILAVWLASSRPATAYPEFQTFSEKHSGKTTNCAMCHTNPAGPIGDEEGQIGSLTAAQMERLSRARVAIKPGSDIESPILNKFGNQILHDLGRTKIIELKENPAGLEQALGTKGDLDADGIADSKEFMDGTDPLNPYHGDPWKLALVNIDRYKIQIGLAIISIALLDYGFMQILHGLSAIQKVRRSRSQVKPPES